ncbi:hypothetical protein EYC84_004225 [Monilinia fructicola]|uniref:Uncharacterized protein n=1 Tax=Monilinia fructicola TaxID=38448 RepID=A0A5M9K2I8_MONFR|nr:hypothetical protein EYC84_004225 [Monilinia fructicola]
MTPSGIRLLDIFDQNSSNLHTTSETYILLSDNFTHHTKLFSYIRSELGLTIAAHIIRSNRSNSIPFLS